MALVGVVECPLCSGRAVRLPVRSVEERGYGCEVCAGFFIVNVAALPRKGLLPTKVRDGVRAVMKGGEWGRVKLDANGAPAPYRITKSGGGRTSAYWQGVIGRLMGLNDLQNPNRIGDKSYLEWYDGWSAVGREYA